MADRLSHCIFGEMREAIVRRGGSENYYADSKRDRRGIRY